MAKHSTHAINPLVQNGSVGRETTKEKQGFHAIAWFTKIKPIKYLGGMCL